MKVTMKSKLFQAPSKGAWALIAVGLLAVGVAAACQLSHSPAFGPDSARAATGSIDTAQFQPHPAPDFVLKDLSGKEVKLSDYLGKVVVLNFWATWCPPCRKEIPDFIELQKQYGTEGLQFIGIALDDEGAAKVKPWLTKNPITYPILLPDGKVVATYGDMTSIPVTFVIDRKGVVQSTYTGQRPRAYLEGLLKPLLAEK
jgi:cytochrome c biogenesis protein CcmG/thiol:disulfide interchange protein DsbE